MKRNFGIGFLLVFAATAIFMLSHSTGQATVEQEAPVLMETPACPFGTVTVEGCIDIEDGCTFINTINGRKIYVNIANDPVAPGDEASLTGQFLTDQDCAPCVLGVTSATDLGDC